MCVYVYVYIDRNYSKTFLNRPNMRPKLNGPMRTVVGIVIIVLCV